MISLKNLCSNSLEKETNPTDLGLVLPQKYFRLPTLFFSTYINVKGVYCPESIYDGDEEDSYKLFKTVKVSYSKSIFNVEYRIFSLDCRCGFEEEQARNYTDYEEVYKKVEEFIGVCSVVSIYEGDTLKNVFKNLVNTDKGLIIQLSGAKEYIKALSLNFLD